MYDSTFGTVHRLLQCNPLCLPSLVGHHHDNGQTGVSAAVHSSFLLPRSLVRPRHHPIKTSIVVDKTNTYTNADSLKPIVHLKGRISFYLQSAGEEALQMGGAAALEFEDMAFTQYREPGILMWRDFGIQVLLSFMRHLDR